MARSVKWPKTRHCLVRTSMASGDYKEVVFNILIRDCDFLCLRVDSFNLTDDAVDFLCLQ